MTPNDDERDFAEERYNAGLMRDEAPTLKAVTRCECRERRYGQAQPECGGDHVFGPDCIGSTYKPDECVNDAVRMVTVPDEKALDAAIAWYNEANNDRNRIGGTTTDAEVALAQAAVNSAKQGRAGRSVWMCGPCADFHEKGGAK